jgi:hypothetical protein
VLISVDLRSHPLTRGVTGYRAHSVHIMEDHPHVQRVKDRLTVVTSDDSRSDYGSVRRLGVRVPSGAQRCGQNQLKYDRWPALPVRLSGRDFDLVRLILRIVN